MTYPTTDHIAGAIRVELHKRVGPKVGAIRFDDGDVRIDNVARPGSWHVRSVAYPVGLGRCWDDALDAVRRRYPQACAH